MTLLENPLTTAWQYFANSTGAVHFVPGQYAYLHWHGGPMVSEELRALYVHARNVLRSQGMRCILADHRAMPPIAAAERQWLVQEWLPETLVSTKYSHCAVLRAPDPATRLHTDAVVELLRQHVVLEIFPALAPAAAWLAEVVNPTSWPGKGQ